MLTATIDWRKQPRNRRSRDITLEPDTCAILEHVEWMTGVSVHSIMHTRRRKGAQYEARRLAILAAWKRFDNASAVAKFFEIVVCTVWRTVNESTAEQHATSDEILCVLKIERIAA